jgi:hypothetical protein
MAFRRVTPPPLRVFAAVTIIASRVASRHYYLSLMIQLADFAIAGCHILPPLSAIAAGQTLSFRATLSVFNTLADATLRRRRHYQLPPLSVFD